MDRIYCKVEMSPWDRFTGSCVMNKELDVAHNGKEKAARFDEV